MGERGQQVSVLASDHRPPASFLFLSSLYQKWSLWPHQHSQVVKSIESGVNSTTQKLCDFGKICKLSVPLFPCL